MKRLLLVSILLCSSVLFAQTSELYDSNPLRIINTWTGNNSIYWSNSANWDQGHIPTASEEVWIPDRTREPIISAGYSYSCARVLIFSESSLIISGTLTVSGDVDFANSSLIINGTLTVNGNINSYGSLSMTSPYAVLYANSYLNFYSNSTLTIPYNGSTIYVLNSMYFNSGSNINPTYGNFIFNGFAGNMVLNVNASIYNLFIDSPNFTQNTGSGNLTINGNLTVSNNRNYTSNVNSNTYINKDIYVGTGGTLKYNNGTVYCQGSANSVITTRTGCYFNNLTIDKNPGFSVTTNSPLSINGNVTVNSGTFDCHDALTIYGNVDISDSMNVYQSTIYLSQSRSLRVYEGGVFNTMGSVDNYSLITRNVADTGYYTFTVYSGGVLNAVRTFFEYMDASGIDVQNGATITTPYAFNYCLLQYGAPGGKLLSINNDQDLYLYKVNFPGNNWSGAYNVSKTNNAGSLNFYSCIGNFSGSAYEQDSFGRINWYPGSIPEPKNLHISMVENNSQVNLSWEYPFLDAIFYIYSSSNAHGPFDYVTSTNTGMINLPVITGTNEYFFRITAFMDP